jgi:hypothetical protein
VPADRAMRAPNYKSAAAYCRRCGDSGWIVGKQEVGNFDLIAVRCPTTGDLSALSVRSRSSYYMKPTMHRTNLLLAILLNEHGLSCPCAPYHLRSIANSEDWANNLPSGSDVDEHRAKLPRCSTKSTLTPLSHAARQRAAFVFCAFSRCFHRRRQCSRRRR